MSTILRTLKKLEAEKSVREKNHDLKKLVLQGSDTGPSAADGSVRRKFGLGGGLLLCGFFLGMGAVALFFRMDPDPSQVGGALRPQKPAKPPAGIAAPAASDLPAGIPLAHIGETAPGAPQMDFQQDEVFEPEAELYATAPPGGVAPAAAPALPPLEAEVAQIDTLIKSVTSQASLAQPKSSDVSTEENSIHIPGLKVKGIVYFDKDHPANHIYVNTPTEANVKLKTDQVEQRALLKSILPNRAVFLYEGRRVELAIGE